MAKQAPIHADPLPTYNNQSRTRHSGIRFLRTTRLDYRADNIYYRIHVASSLSQTALVAKHAAQQKKNGHTEHNYENKSNKSLPRKMDSRTRNPTPELEAETPPTQTSRRGKK
jgi:hypothetical protein